MLKRKPKIFLIASLILALILPTYLSFVSSSTGSIKINTTGDSTPGQQVQAGGNVNLYLGGVSWIGENFYLFLTQDSSSEIGSGLVYTPTFSVYDVANVATFKTYSGEYGTWISGNNWINGSIPSTSALGNYYIKAVDQIGSVAKTDTYLTINPVAYNSTLNVSPSSGPGGLPITFTGSGWPAGSNVQILYNDPVFGWKILTSVNASMSGQISVASEAPDLKQSIGKYDAPETYTSISYRAQVASGSIISFTNYDEYKRGIKTVGNSTAYGLYGNGTNLVSNVRAMVDDTIAISGNWFHPGPIYIRWDGVNVVGTVSSSEWLNANIIGTTASNGTGFFSTYVTIPHANAGEHYIAIEDSQTRVIVKIFISTASLLLSPAFGPGGATVQFSGSSYPVSSAVDVYYLDPAFSTWNYWTTTSSDASGQISFSTEMPDLRQYSYSGDSNYSSTLSFRTQVNSIAYSYADYREYARGLQQVGTKVAYSLFGNGTDLSSNVSVKPGDSLFISGKWFHPGIVYVKFDGINVVGTVTGQEWQNAQILGSTTASQGGSFQTYVTIPTASGGVHYLAIEDTGSKLITRVNVISSYISPTPTPTSQPTSNPTSNPTPNPQIPTPTLDLSCKSTPSALGSKVEISGNLLLNGNPVAESPILIAYSVTGGNTWQSLTLVKTLTDGAYAAVWQPDVTGNYLIKATSAATSTMNYVEKTINLALTPDASHNVFTLTSNSTITQFTFNPEDKELSFIASGPSDTNGYVNVYIPKTIINDISTLKAYLDGNQISFNSEAQADSWLISFTYSHSTHTITMTLAEPATISNPNTNLIPEIVYYIIPVAAIALVLATVFTLKRKSKPATKI